METYAQMTGRLKKTGFEITPAMVAAAKAECPEIDEAVVLRVLEAGLPYSIKHFKVACAVAPQIEEHVVDLMLDAALDAIA